MTEYLARVAVTLLTSLVMATGCGAHQQAAHQPEPDYSSSEMNQQLTEVFGKKLGTGVSARRVYAMAYCLAINQFLDTNHCYRTADGGLSWEDIFVSGTNELLPELIVRFDTNNDGEITTQELEDVVDSVPMRE